YFQDIPPSRVFIPLGNESAPPTDQLIIHDSNWKGARENPEVLESLIQDELANNYIEEVPLEEARRRWEHVAVGKLNVVIVPEKNPRLTVDETISGVNPACSIPERYNLPGLSDLQAGYPLRGPASALGVFSLDVKAAHKSILLREQDRGLAGITFQGRTFFYRVMPFGMSCSAYWWQRLSGFLVRTWHSLLWLSHFLSMYVDDLILAMQTGALDISACLILAFAAVFGVRLSWPKLQLGSSVVWIGWSLNYRAGTVQVTAAKKEKLSRVLRPLLGEGRVELRELQKALGLLQWLTQLHVELRPWLSVLYDDATRTAIPLGSKLISARHVDITCKADLRKVPLTSKRIWLRIADPQARFRRLSKLSRKLLSFWYDWSQSYHFHECLHLPPRRLDCVMAADAFASGEELGIGGFILARNQCGSAKGTTYLTSSTLICLFIVMPRGTYPAGKHWLKWACNLRETSDDEDSTLLFCATGSYGQHAKQIYFHAGTPKLLLEIAGILICDTAFLFRISLSNGMMSEFSLRIPEYSGSSRGEIADAVDGHPGMTSIAAGQLQCATGFFSESHVRVSLKTGVRLT
ncbi:gag-pol, partial [Symbiodinium necroappetens]